MMNKKFTTCEEIAEIIMSPIIENLETGKKFIVKDIIPFILWESWSDHSGLGLSLSNLSNNKELKFESIEGNIKENCQVYMKL